MLQARTHAEIESLRAGISRVGGLSDSLIKFGPFGIGLDGILAWVPVVGALYSGAAALTMIAMGWRARVPLSIRPRKRASRRSRGTSSTRVRAAIRRRPSPPRSPTSARK